MTAKFSTLDLAGNIIAHGDTSLIIGDRLAVGTFCNIYECKPLHSQSQTQTIDAPAASSSAPAPDSDLRFIIKVFRNIRQFRRTVRAAAAIDKITSAPENAARQNIEQVLGMNSITRILPETNTFMSVPYVIMPQYDMRLKDYLKKHVAECEAGLPALATLTVAQQLFQALDYLERAGVVHGDIKPGNILLRGQPVFNDQSVTHFDTLLCDFGSARIVDAQTHTCGPACVGTDGFIAPEVMLGCEYSFGADIWSAMVTIFYVITGDYLFDILDETDLEYGFNTAGILIRNAMGDESSDSIPSHMDADDGRDDISGDDDMGETEEAGSYEISDIDFPTMYAHIVLMYRLLGKPPEAFCSIAEKYYHNGMPRYSQSIVPGTILQFFSTNYHNLNRNTMQHIEEFLLLGLQYMASDRNSARVILAHKFFRSLNFSGSTANLDDQSMGTCAGAGAGPNTRTCASTSQSRPKNRKKKH